MFNELVVTRKLFKSLMKDGATKEQAVEVIEAIINAYERVSLDGIKNIIKEYEDGKKEEK